MGRSEKRALERINNKKATKDNKILNSYIQAVANQKKLKDNAIDELQTKVIHSNVNCLFIAFAKLLKDKYGKNVDEIVEDLSFIDEYIGKIGTEEYPTISDFKIQNCIDLEIQIGLDEDETELYLEHFK